MRIALEIPAILERSGLAFVAIDHHQPGPGLAEHRAPFSRRGKACTAETSQGCVVERLQEIVPGQLTRAQALEQRIAARGDIGVVIDVVRQMRMGIARLCRRKHARHCGIVDKVMADLGHRRCVAAADAGRAHDADAGAGLVLQLVQQLLRPHHGAGEGIADADGQRRNVRLALLHHVEMRVEGRGLEDFGKRQLHFVGKRCKVGGGNLTISVLDQVQMLDQEVAAAWPIAEQTRDLICSHRVDLATLGRRFGAPTPLARMVERTNFLHAMFLHVVAHQDVSRRPDDPAVRVAILSVSPNFQIIQGDKGGNSSGNQ